MISPTEPCPFCNPPVHEIVVRNDLCYAKWDTYPVSVGHILIIPFRHTPDFFSLNADERHALTDLIYSCKESIERTYKPDGYNIGLNVGIPAGQTIMHCHCHVIPRYTGDVPNPRGGIRAVIRSRQHY